MMDLKQKNGHTSAGRKRNFSIESILQGDILKHPLKSTPGGNVLDNLKDSRADASSRQACAIVPAGTSSELHDDTDLGLLESSSVADDYRRQQHSSSSSDHHPYVAPGLPFALPPVDSQRAEHFDWINCTRYNPPKIHRDLSTTSLGNCTISELPKKRKYLSRSPRIPFNSAQLSVLEEQFRQAPYLSGAEVQRLANELDMSDVRVKIWFQNRRAREKRERLAKTTTGQHQIADAATLPTQARSAMELNSDKRGPSDSLGTSAEHLQSVELALLPQSNRKCHS